MTRTLAPYDGLPYAPIGDLTAAEHAWRRGLIARAWPELGWHVVGRDAAGHLVAVTVMPCGTSDPGANATGTRRRGPLARWPGLPQHHRRDRRDAGARPLLTPWAADRAGETPLTAIARRWSVF